jgi:hypothetical protein
VQQFTKDYEHSVAFCCIEVSTNGLMCSEMAEEASGPLATLTTGGNTKQVCSLIFDSRRLTQNENQLEISYTFPCENIHYRLHFYKVWAQKQFPGQHRCIWTYVTDF